jgi:predicted small secreted protein
MWVRTTKKALLLILLLGAIPALNACNTTAGAGKDISNTGRAIENSANRHAP